jgi:hypothetical protein
VEDRLPRRPRRVARELDAGEPAALDRERIAVERADGHVVVLRRDGRVLGRVAPGGQPPSIGFFELHPPTVGLSGA